MATAPTSSIETIVVNAIPMGDLRYPTAGDWYYDLHSGVHRIQVCELGDWRYEFLVALHELVEMALCRHHGVSQKEVDDWDLAHPDADEPGELPDCPYFEMHAFATLIERMMAWALAVKWADYEAAVNGTT